MFKQLILGMLLLLMAASALAASELKSIYYNANIDENNGVINISYSVLKGFQRYAPGPFLSLQLKPETAQEFRGRLEASKEIFPRIFDFTGKEGDGASITGRVIFAEDTIEFNCSGKLSSGRAAPPDVICDSEYLLDYMVEGLNFMAQASDKAYCGAFTKIIKEPFTVDQWIEIYPAGWTRCKMTAERDTAFTIKDAKTRTFSIKHPLKWATIRIFNKSGGQAAPDAKTAFKIEFRPFESPASQLTGTVVAAVSEANRFDVTAPAASAFENNLRITPAGRRSPVYTLGKEVALDVERTSNAPGWDKVKIEVTDAFSGKSVKFTSKAVSDSKMNLKIEPDKGSAYNVLICGQDKSALLKYEVAVAGPIAQREVTWDKMDAALNKKLVGEIDVTSDSDKHEKYAHGGPARIVRKDLGTYWESAPCIDIGDACWLSVRFDLPNPDKVHLIEIDYPDDDGRNIGFSVGSIYASPRSGDTKLLNTCAPGGVACGAPYPLSNKMRTWQTVYFPAKNWGTIQATSLKSGQTAAISKIRIYELPDGLPALKTFEIPGVKPRLFGQHWERYLLGHKFLSDTAGVQIDWGFISDEKTYYRGTYRIWENLARYLRFRGDNMLQPSVYMFEQFLGIQGYDFSYYGEQKDPVELLARIFAANRLNLILATEIKQTDKLRSAFNVTDAEVGQGARTMTSVSPSGIQNATELGNPFRVHHIRPNTKLYLEELKKIYAILAGYFKNTPGIVGIANNLYPPSFDPSYAFPRHWWKKYMQGNILLEFSYDDETINEFEKYSGRKIPVASGDKERFRKRYDWLMANARPEWMRFRAEIFRKANREIGAVVKSINPQWDYMVVSPLLLLNEYRYVQAKLTTPEDLEKQAGYPPELYKDEKDVQLVNCIPTVNSLRHAPDVFQERMMRACSGIDFYRKTDNGARTCYWLGNPFTEVSKPNLYKIPWFFRYFNPVEYSEPAGEFIFKDLASAMAYGNPAVFVSIFCDCHMMTGNENFYQRILAAYRALPPGSYKFLKPPLPGEAVLRYGEFTGTNIFYMANPTFFEKEMTISSGNITDLTTGRELQPENGRIAIKLAPCDLKAFGANSQVGLVEEKTDYIKFFDTGLTLLSQKTAQASKAGIDVKAVDEDQKRINELIRQKEYDQASDILVNSFNISKMNAQLINSASGESWPWYFLGPFSLTSGSGYMPMDGKLIGFDKAHIEEGAGPDLTRTYNDFKGDQIKWEKYITKRGIINFGSIYPWEGDYTVSYACIGVESGQDQDAVLSVGSSDNVRIWVNGSLVHNMPLGDREAKPGQDKVKVRFNKGYNLIMFKLHNYIGLYQIMLEILPADKNSAIKMVPPCKNG